MKFAKAVCVVALVAVLATPPAVSAEDPTAGVGESSSGQSDGVLQQEPAGSQSKKSASAGAATRSTSPAGCAGAVNHAHASHYHPGKIGYQATVGCRHAVDKIYIEVWGDRKHVWGIFSYWRQHTDGHDDDSVKNRTGHRWSQHKRGDSGSHHYRTRAYVYSIENGKKYWRDMEGAAIRISCGWDRLYGYDCSD